MTHFSTFNPYPSFRPGQAEAIQEIISELEAPDGAEYIVLKAPTGIGKSIIAYITANYMKSTLNFETFLVTPLKMLMDQYEKEFQNQGLAFIKGSDNYKCLVNQRPYTEGVCQGSGQKTSFSCYDKCPYQVAKSAALLNQIVVSNFHYLLLETTYVKRFQPRDLAIFDEAHNIEHIILDFASVEFNQSIIDRINQFIEAVNTNDGLPWTRIRQRIGTQVPIKEDILTSLVKDDEGDSNRLLEVVRDTLLPTLTTLLAAAEVTISLLMDQEGMTEQDKIAIGAEMKLGETQKQIGHLRNITTKLSKFTRDFTKTEWVVERKTEGREAGVSMKPLHIDFLLNETLFPLAKKKIFMSATIEFSQFCKNIGIPTDKAKFIDIPACFPVENRPVQYIPVGEMNYRNMDELMPTIIELIGGILDHHKGEKGIIHCVSYKNAETIRRGSKHTKRILTHTSVSKDAVLREFYASDDKVLVSPSITEGLDLKGDLSRFQVFIKVPYLSLGDKRTARRMKIDRDWYAYHAIVSILQGYGRSIRSETDRATTYFLDKNLGRLMAQYPEYFGSYFMDAVKWHG